MLPKRITVAVFAAIVSIASLKSCEPRSDLLIDSPAMAAPIVASQNAASEIAPDV
jgi:hypothetical protein